MKNFIELHLLQNFAPSNLNRDDTGAPKDAFFGGVRRARISSQCLKRAVRQHFAAIAATGILSSQSLATRTKRLMTELQDQLVTLGRSEQEIVDKVRQGLLVLGLPADEEGKNQYLLFLGKQEIASLALAINEHWDKLAIASAEEEGKKSGKAKKDAAKQADPALKAAFAKVLDGGKALDVALFGRMLADLPEKNQDAACQVAHALSTHAVEREFDFYTAVDDLKPDDNAGADMMGTVEFNSACFYRYAVLDHAKLTENLQGDGSLTEAGLRAFCEGFVIAEPTGKQNTFAAHNAPEFVVATVRRDGAPRNLANAFEIPVRTKAGASLTAISAGQLIAKAEKLDAAYGAQGKAFVLDLVGSELPQGWERVATLAELLEKVVSASKE